MSDRVERLREGYAAFNRGDFDALRELAADAIELRNLVSPEPIVGKDAVIDWFRPDAFDEQRTEVRYLRESGDRVYVEVEFFGRGRGSGIELRRPGYVVFEYEDDLIVRMTAYPERGAALAAAGIA